MLDRWSDRDRAPIAVLDRVSISPSTAIASPASDHASAARTGSRSCTAQVAHSSASSSPRPAVAELLPQLREALGLRLLPEHHDRSSSASVNGVCAVSSAIPLDDDDSNEDPGDSSCWAPSLRAGRLPEHVQTARPWSLRAELARSLSPGHRAPLGLVGRGGRGGGRRTSRERIARFHQPRYRVSA